MHSNLENFYTALKEIETVNTNLKTKREILQQYTVSFNDVVQNKSIDKKILENNQELGILLEETLSLLKISSQNWIEHFNEMLEKEKFRSELEDYFIVIIFGKVKAGKSSLGNFIAQNRLPKQPIEFFKYDEAGQKQEIKQLEELHEQGFATNNLECTVEIQGFKLEGMAWIDTPGLGSMVKENGDLAKEYIQSADYIIYPTSSDSPLQQDEMAQLKELFEQNKKVTICITKSDYHDEDECECGSEYGCKKCDGGLIKVLKNKSQERRVKQEAYVKEEIKKLIPNNSESVLGDIFSISSHTAKRGLKENDIELFEESNIPKFYTLLTEVVEKKSQALKKNTPYDSLNAFIENHILGNQNLENQYTLLSMKESIHELDEKIQSSIEAFSLLKKNASSDISSEVDSIVASYMATIDKYNAQEIFAQIDVKLEEVVVKLIQENIQKIFETFETTLQDLHSKLNREEFVIEDKYETIRQRYKDNGLTNLWGLFGDRYSTVKERINVGDNKQEVISKFKTSRIDGFNQIAQENYQSIEEEFFIPLQNISQEMKNEIQQLEEKIVVLKNSLGEA